MDAVAEQTEVGTGTESVSVQLPKTMKDWLERKALERKQRTGGRFAVSPIVVELIDKAMHETEPAPPKGRKKSGGDKGTE